MSLTRRATLKLIAAGAATAALSPVLHALARYPAPPEPEDPNTWLWMGRAIHPAVFYEQPALSAARVGSCRADRAFIILQETRAPLNPHNDVWYMTNFGYVPSAWVQPLRVYPPQPFIGDAGAWGFWGEVSQVLTDARAEPDLRARVVYRFYGGTVYRVLTSYQDAQGVGWYKVYDDFPPNKPGGFQWVLARDVRRIPPAEMSPIHPFISQKRIEVSIAEQRLTCYEGDYVVFTTQVASGIEKDGTGTPRGRMPVLLKQASRHMSNHPYEGGPEPVGALFDLPGVPWNTFFDMNGTAIHGTYWHNDFGVQRSHGCLNVPCEAARWIYRWTHPVSGYADAFVQSDASVSTPIIVT